MDVMAPRAVFFDMDDTLLDTTGGVQESWKSVAATFSTELGCEPEALQTAIRSQMMAFWKDEAAVEHWRTRLHDARTHNIEQALLGLSLNAARAKALSDLYWDEQSNRMKLFNDAIETLETLRASGFRLALLTNGPAEMQRWKLGKFPLAEHFDVVVIEGEFGYGKPDARVFRHALETVGAKADEAWHIGDNLYADVGGAQGAGIHATWIHRDRLELDAEIPHVPDRVIGHLAELREPLGL